MTTTPAATIGTGAHGATARRIRSWFFSPAPAERLAAFRILVGGYAALWGLVRLPEHLRHTSMPATRWEPVGVLAPVGDPLPDAVVVAVAIALPVLGVLAATGWRWPVTSVAFFSVLLVGTSLDSSWGQVFHTENLLVLHAALLAASPAAGHALVLGRSRSRAQPEPAPHFRYGWPLRAAALVVVVAYVLAGLAKLDATGLSWASGDVLRHLVAHDNLRKALVGDVSSPIGEALVAHRSVFWPMAGLTLTLELGALAALVQRWRTAWVAGAWVVHVGVLAIMAIAFPYQLAGVAFAPFFALERVVDRRPGRRAAAATSGLSEVGAP